MGILIKNAETERLARELAARTGQTLTGVIDTALREFDKTRHSRRKTAREILEATDRFRRETGLDRIPPRPVTKEEWDALWPTGVAEYDES